MNAAKTAAADVEKLGAAAGWMNAAKVADVEELGVSAG
jgi:hypothetical protein